MSHTSGRVPGTGDVDRVLVVIPARLDSTRLPGKLLMQVSGKSILHHTFLAVRRARSAGDVVVATPDEAIAREVESFGGTVAWTDPHAASGTDRVAEVVARSPHAAVCINVQGDEPDIPPEYIDQLAKLLRDHAQAQVVTLAAPITASSRLHDSACVKVVFNALGQALYFSRSPIPFLRDGLHPDDAMEVPLHWQHLGIYGYRREFLLELPRIPHSRLEAAERLEQLRFLDAGYSILVGKVPRATHGIDTIEDYRAFVANCRSQANSEN